MMGLFCKHDIPGARLQQAGVGRVVIVGTLLLNEGLTSRSLPLLYYEGSSSSSKLSKLVNSQGPILHDLVWCPGISFAFIASLPLRKFWLHLDSVRRTVRHLSTRTCIELERCEACVLHTLRHTCLWRVSRSLRTSKTSPLHPQSVFPKKDMQIKFVLQFAACTSLAVSRKAFSSLDKSFGNFPETFVQTRLTSPDNDMRSST